MLWEDFGVAWAGGTPVLVLDLVPSCWPQALRNSPASVGLFKEEFRAAQRLRSSESVFIPEVWEALGTVEGL